MTDIHDLVKERVALDQAKLAAAKLAAPKRDEVEAVARAINDARYEGGSEPYPAHLRKTFDDADASDREYSLRLSRAAIAALDDSRAREKGGHELVAFLACWAVEYQRRDGVPMKYRHRS